MTRKEIEELSDEDIIELYKLLDNFTHFLEKEMENKDDK